MTILEEMRRHGAWLFRWRSYLPLALALLFAAALPGAAAGRDPAAGWPAWELFCLGISLTGQALRVLTVGFVPFGTSGRNTAAQVAQQLNTTGVYSLVRHPLYVANLIIWVGLSLFVARGWFTLLIILIYWLYYERIALVEEDYLEAQFGDTFRHWAARTPTFIPLGGRWVPPALPFSLRTVLRREYGSFFAIVVSFTVLDVAANLAAAGQLALSPMWKIIFALGAGFYLTLRVIKKCTRLLEVKGR